MRRFGLGVKATADEDTRSATEVFGELYEEYLPKVFHYISYRVGDADLAEDLTSAVFEKTLTRFNSYRSDKASFSTWLFSIARNVVVDYYRVGGKRPSVALEQALEIPSNRGSPEEKTIRREELQRLHILLTGLSQREQEIISLKFGAESTNRQIATMLNLSESNVGTMLYRAICKLRDNFGGC